MQTRRRFIHSAGALCLGGASLLTLPEAHAAEAASDVVRIGIVKSIFYGYPSTWISFITQPLRALMEAQTGLKGEVILLDDAESLAKQLNENKVHVGVFHGVELGWARQFAPKLKPMVVAIKGQATAKACLVTAKDLKAEQIADLKGKSISIEKRSRLHCRLYLERRCPDAATDPEKYFSQIKFATSATRGLDWVATGEMDAAIVDDVALESYRTTKATRYANLHVVSQSGTFPAGVIAYHPDHLSEAKLKKLKDGLRTAHTSTRGKHLLQLTKIDHFADVPADFEKLVEEITKLYPMKVK